MVSIYKRGTKLYLQYTANGRRRQKSTGLEDTPTNRKMLKNKVIPQLETKIMNGDIDKKKPTLFKVYANKYAVAKDHLKTAIEVAHKVDRIVKHFGNREVVSIKRGDVRDFCDKLLTSISPRTVRGYVGILSGILDVAVEYDEISENPAHNIKLPTHTKATTTPFTPEEIEKLIDVAEGQFKAFLAVSFYTGMRTGEVLGLMHGDIDFENKVISVIRSISRGKATTPKTKSGTRKVPMFDNLVPYLKELMKGTKSLYLFSHVESGKHLYGAGSLRTDWRNACTNADVEYRKVYTTRHTFITSMLKSGIISILELAQMVGHKNTEMIMRNYAMFIDGEHLKINRGFNPFSVTVQQTPRDKAQ